MQFLASKNSYVVLIVYTVLQCVQVYTHYFLLMKYMITMLYETSLTYYLASTSHISPDGGSQ